MSENHCVVCFNKDIKIFSIGQCDHPVCYVCSTRMRVLCSQNECPICRHNLSMVVFTDKIQPYRNLKKRYPQFDNDFKIAFASSYIQSSFKFLLINVCKKCYNQPIFTYFDELKNHMDEKHGLYCCELCIDHLKIFPKEQRWYTTSELKRHQLSGDPDDTSHRGHPLCKFCEIRFLDKDELYRHLRRGHLYCHICDAEGIQGFYREYESLRNHFRSDHYLCEDGNCANEQFTSVFSSQLDLEAHQAVTHCKNNGKRGERFARLEFQITLVPRAGDRNAANSDAYNGNSNKSYEHHHHHHPERDTDVASAQHVENQQFRAPPRPSWLNSGPSLEQAFPALGSGPAIPIQRPTVMKHTGGGRNKLAMTDQNFPALSSEPSRYVADITNNNNNVPTGGTTSVSYTSSTVRVNQPKVPKKRVVNSLHINPSSNSDIVAVDNNRSVQSSSCSSNNACSVGDWANKIKSTNEKKNNDNDDNDYKNNKKHDDDKKTNNINKSRLNVNKDEFPSLGDNNDHVKKQNKKSSVTVHIGNVNNNNNNKENKNKKSKCNATDWSNVVIGESTSSSNINQKKNKIKLQSNDTSCSSVDNSNNKGNRGKNKNVDEANKDKNNSDNSIVNHTNTAAATHTGKSKAKKKCSLVALVNDDDDEADNSILINFHSRSRNNKQKNNHNDDNRVSADNGSKQNKQIKNNKSTKSLEWTRLLELANATENGTTSVKSNKVESVSKKEADCKNANNKVKAWNETNSISGVNTAGGGSSNKKTNKTGHPPHDDKTAPDKSRKKPETNESNARQQRSINNESDNRSKLSTRESSRQNTKTATTNMDDVDNAFPPGFSITPDLSAPPGFSNGQGNSLTFTNSQGRSYVMNNNNTNNNNSNNNNNNNNDNAAAEFNVYKQPVNFYSRNKELLQKIMTALKMVDGVNRLNEFKNASLLYKNGYITGVAYYTYCKDSIRLEQFDEIFIDLVILLPDIVKQQELWAVYCADRLSESKRICLRIAVCTVCCQILAKEDFDAHLIEHRKS